MNFNILLKMVFRIITILNMFSKLHELVIVQARYGFWSNIMENIMLTMIFHITALIKGGIYARYFVFQYWKNINDFT